jgi:hypothetical protein
MAQIDADQRDYVSLPAPRDGEGGRSSKPGAGGPAMKGDLARALIGLVSSLVMLASEK